MTLTFDSDIKDAWDSFYLYYEELGCYFEIIHSNEADYYVRFPAYQEQKGFREYLLNTDISIFERNSQKVIDDAINQITEIGQRNMLPQQSNIMIDLIDIIFTSGKVFKVKE